MLASLADAPLTDPQLIYEPKYDGIRAIVEIEGPRAVRLWSRLGNEKTGQFPEIAQALQKWAQRRDDLPLILDGEIVALDAAGRPAGFQQLQGRIHLSSAESGRAPLGPTALIVFDLLRSGKTDYRDRPLTERRAALEKTFGRTQIIHLSPERERARRRSGAVQARARQWLGGPDREARRLALPVGQANARLAQAENRSRTGIRRRRLDRAAARTRPISARSRWASTTRASSSMLVKSGRDSTRPGSRASWLQLKPLETTECPFRDRPKTNERPHWVRPALVAQVKFTEWTADGNLRHPVYLGLRDDKKAADVRREESSHLRAAADVRPKHEAPGLQANGQIRHVRCSPQDANEGCQA